MSVPGRGSFVKGKFRVLSKIEAKAQRFSSPPAPEHAKPPHRQRPTERGLRVAVGLHGHAVPPQSPGCVRSLRVLGPVGSGRCLMTGTHRDGVMQRVVTPLKLLGVLPVHPPHPHPLATPGLFTGSIVLPFPESHRVGNLRDMASSDGFLPSVIRVGGSSGGFRRSSLIAVSTECSPSAGRTAGCP